MLLHINGKFTMGKLKFHTGASQENEKKLAQSFNFTFRSIEDAFSLNNSRFGDFVDRYWSKGFWAVH
jgi:hypothetical protein